MSDPVPQQRVGQKPDAVEVDEDRCMSYVLNSSAQDRKSASADFPVAQDP
jgi:hypothetical protein